jgi:hypothetical protein
MDQAKGGSGVDHDVREQAERRGAKVGHTIRGNGRGGGPKEKNWPKREFEF